MGPDGYNLDHLTSTRVESHPGTAPDTAEQPNQAGSRSDDGKPGASSSAATNSARTPDCPACAALREQNRLLSEHNLVLITRVRAFEDRDRLGAEMLLGLAGLQKAAGA
ncbi:MAG TPA: hypothetical protein P5164_15450 [Thermoanaerobaculia bacterium]|nr:hypothetical protein [Thermoanaerobaculia bacterium]